MKTFITKILAFVIASLLFIGTWHLLVVHPPGPAFRLQNQPAVPTKQALFESHWISDEETAEAHSANLALVDEQPVAVWYGGTEEGHRDVAIFMATFNGQWSTPVPVMDRRRAELALGRYIRKVGNPALYAWSDGRLSLYFVTVSVGGWAASSINVMETTDLGRTWSVPRRLVTSPFLNLSTLVRAPGLPLKDGSMLLPAYHEFMGKFAETIRLTDDQRIIGKTRLSRGKHSLQPAVLPATPQDADALLRYSGSGEPRLLRVSTHDGGRHWTHPEITDLPNPDSAVAGLALDADTDLLALNNTEDGRHRLSLAIRKRGKPWQVIRVIEEQTPSEPGSHEFEFSYPSLVMTGDGTIHLAYTWNQKRIRHLRFNRAWLEAL